MSKTETQSDAQKLSALLAVAMAFDHGRIGTDRRFVEMDATVAASIDAELRRLDAENKALRERLETLLAANQLDALVRAKLGAPLNAFGEAQWQAGRGVPCPSIEDAFEAVISGAVDLLAAAKNGGAA